MTIWRQLALSAVLGSAVMPVMLAQRHDQYQLQRLEDKVADQEKHLDHTDVTVEKNTATINALREQVDQYRDYALGFAGCFTVFMGILKYLGRKGESSS